MDGPQNVTDYQKLLSELIKKQIALLGLDIALSRARNVANIEVLDDGSVTRITGDPRLALQKVIDEYFVFSGMIVKKAMESLLQSYPSMVGDIEETAKKAVETEATEIKQAIRGS